MWLHIDDQVSASPPHAAPPQRVGFSGRGAVESRRAHQSFLRRLSSTSSWRCISHDSSALVRAGLAACPGLFNRCRESDFLPFCAEPAAERGVDEPSLSPGDTNPTSCADPNQG
jgi:hypothetical protein